MITKLRLQGWKSHLDSSFSFSSGVNALVGIMGSGKSSVTDGIAFGLFGTFPALQSRRVSLDDLVMARPQTKEKAVVEVAFDMGGSSYEITRTIQRGKKTTAEIRKDGQLVEVSTRGVTREVERLLEMDYEVFSKAIYSEQNSIDYFLRIPSGQRRQHIDRMLRLELYELVRGEAVALQGTVKAGNEELGKVIADLQDSGSEKRAQELDKEITVLKKEHDQLTKKMQNQKERKQSLENQLVQVRKAEEELNTTLRLLEGLKGGLEEIESREGKSRKIVRGKDLGNLDKELDRLGRLREETMQKLDRAKQHLHDQLARKQVNKESLASIHTLDGVCPLCESQVPPEKKISLVADRERERDQLEEELVQERRQVSRLKQEVESLDRTLDTKRIERERVSQAYKEIKELGEKLQEIVNVKTSYEEKIAHLKEVLEGMNVASVRDEQEEAIASLGKWEAEAAALKERIEDKNAALLDVKEQVERLVRFKNTFSQEQDIIKQLQVFREVLKATQEELRSTFLKNVNTIMEMIWSQLYPYQDLESARLAVVGGDYVLQVNAGGWLDADGVSGGERSLACLALRIAFSLAFLPNLKWLILDEPTHNLDANAIATLGMVMRDRLTRFTDQVFLITHDPSLSEGLESVYRLERNKEANEPTRVVVG